MRETRTIEFKETITNTFLKTVSAFSNYDGGVIYFGLDDKGTIKGLSDVEKACLDIENKVNDSITPQPDYTLELQNNDRTIKLTVKSGLQKPYLYKSKAYKRNNTATIEVDTLELSRLILEGKNIKFEELPCEDQELTFDILCRKLKECIQIETFNQDTLKTLNLYNSAIGYNNAAGILADKNHFPGIDIVRFGENIRVIHKRETMFDDRIELISPGGLPSGISEDEYLSGKLSVLRNRNLANVFYRLGFVEIFGTGITRIKQLYEEGLIQPGFEISENAIKMILPVFERNLNLTEDERKIYRILSRTMLRSISEITPYVAFGKSKTTQLLKEMCKKGVVRIEGRGRGTKYVIK